MEIKDYEKAIEAMLFASGESVLISRLAGSLGIDEKTVKMIVARLSDYYENDKRGIKVIQVNESYQMCTNDIYFDYVAKLVKIPAKKNLTAPLLETLAIIAYKQPITRGEIEEIRGVNSGHAVNRLIEYSLVCEMGRKDAPGRPILLGTTDEFLKFYGYKNLSEMPAISSEGDLPEKGENMRLNVDG